ncbi:hypothetical protein GCM10023178_74740 [Actinomadura luteofluorescens]
MDGDERPGTFGQDPLRPVVADGGAQHRVPPHERVHGRLETGRVDRAPVQLDVQVGGDGAEFLAGVAADPVRVLHQRQREGLAGFGGGLAGLRGGPGRGLHLALLREQVPPPGERRTFGQLGEADLDALAPEPPGELHEPDRVHAQLDEVVVRLRAFAQHLGQRGVELIPGQHGTPFKLGKANLIVVIRSVNAARAPTAATPGTRRRGRR